MAKDTESQLVRARLEAAYYKGRLDALSKAAKEGLAYMRGDEFSVQRGVMMVAELQHRINEADKPLPEKL